MLCACYKSISLQTRKHNAFSMLRFIWYISYTTVGTSSVMILILI